MDSNDRFFVYLAVLSFAIIAGLYNFKYKDFASKIIVLLLCTTLASEYMAHWAAIKYGNNMFVYNIFSPIQLMLIGVYFDSINNNKKTRFGFLAGIAGVIVAIVNCIFFQSIHTLNSNFLLFEGLMIMSLALYTFQIILSDDDINIYSYSHFWMVVILIFFWSVTYTWWALYAVLHDKERYILSKIIRVLWSVNVITYAAIGTVFLYFSGKRKQLANE